jgi:Trk K+ transport system NAD-binding subunit
MVIVVTEYDIVAIVLVLTKQHEHNSVDEIARVMAK